MALNERTIREGQARARSYLRCVAVTALAWVGFSIAFAVLIDPYRMYGTASISGWTELKPRIYQQKDIAKTKQLARIAPKTLLLGNSRVEIGFDPESKAWPDNYQPVFNAAEAGRGLPTALARLREDIGIHPPQTIFLGLDFQDFLSRQNSLSTLSHAVSPDEQGLRDTKVDKRIDLALSNWHDRLATTLTFDALYDSFLTILDQNPKTTVTMTPRGFNPLHEYRLYARRTGYYELFLTKAKDYQNQYSAFAMPDFSDPNKLENFRDLAAIVAIARAHSIRLLFFTQPYHADYLEMLHHLGLWPSFEQWKRSIAQFASAAEVPLYDFADYDTFTTERVPAPTDVIGQMRWYWEPGHYTEALGDQMLNTMIKEANSFGRRLTSTNVEEAIVEVRNERASYLPDRDQIARALY